MNTTHLAPQSRRQFFRRTGLTLGSAALANLLREELGAKAAARSSEFSWSQSAVAMHKVLESVHSGDRISGVL